jgi:hypothetical protein
MERLSYYPDPFGHDGAFVGVQFGDNPGEGDFSCSEHQNQIQAP